MSTESDPLIAHAKSNIRYQDVDWLLYQKIESKCFDKILREIQLLCKSHGLFLIENESLLEKSRDYFSRHSFYFYVLSVDIDPANLSMINLETLRKLRYLNDDSQKNSQAQARAVTAEQRANLLRVDKNDPCFLLVVLIPFGGKDAPNAVLCTDACITNVFDIWNTIYFPFNT
ncbi:MAG: hypothetical protein EKK48_04275 [Candidatus Melainabacteria bacterium]|nr:MAG: hypothetical protein EKK48_04275 [Candidatus Melainabacteria bacterium]